MISIKDHVWCDFVLKQDVYVVHAVGQILLGWDTFAQFRTATVGAFVQPDRGINTSGPPSVFTKMCTIRYGFEIWQEIVNAHCGRG